MSKHNGNPNERRGRGEGEEAEAKEESEKIVRALYIILATWPDEETMDPLVQRTSGLSQRTRHRQRSRNNRRSPSVKSFLSDEHTHTNTHTHERLTKACV